MNILRAENLSRSYGDRTLFKGISLSIERGNRIALVARNGAGKTNLLNILAGTDEPDKGIVSVNKNIKTAYLSQHPDMPAGVSVWDHLFNSNDELLSTVAAYEQLINHQSDDPNYLSKLQTVMDQMDILGGWDYESRVKQILSVFRIVDYSQDVASLSGGQQKRLALARVLIQQPDFLILDEPTNHLDLDMIEWLEGYFKSSEMSILMVTHDRYFLDNTSNMVWELTENQLFVYKGNYANFVEKRAERLALKQLEADKAYSLMRKELEWMRRQPKARTTKSKSRIQAFYELEEKASYHHQEKQVELATKMNRLGTKIMEVSSLNKSFGEKQIVSNFSYLFKPGERVGIVGRNGVGKSTFINMLMGLEKPDSGTITIGDTVVFGYYNQRGMEFNPDKRVIEIVQDIAEYVELGKGEKVTATQLCKRFLFDDKIQHSFAYKLSGGEKRRLFLLTILMQNPNFLILDEPTNDLDIDTLNVLEEFLENYKGCLMMVTHDRYFMDKIVDHLFIFEGDGEIRDFNGNYQDYLEEQEFKKLLQTPAKAIATPVPAQSQPKVEKKKVSFKDKRLYEELTAEIETLEKRKQEIEQQLSSSNVEPAIIPTLAKELSDLTAKLDEKSLQWLELAEIVGEA